MNKTIERKGRNPRITVCYTPDENEKIVKLASVCGLKKSQYIHDTSCLESTKIQAPFGLSQTLDGVIRHRRNMFRLVPWR